MIKHKLTLYLNPWLHEDATTVGGTSNEPPVNGSPGSEEPIVVYGKQTPPAGTQTVDGQAPDPSSTPPTDDAVRQSEYAKIKDTYKDLYDSDIKGHIDRRMKNHYKRVSELNSMLVPLAAYMGANSIDEVRDWIQSVLPDIETGEAYQKLMAAVQQAGEGSVADVPEEARLSPADLAAQAVALTDSLKANGVEFNYVDAVKDPAFTGLLDKGLTVQQAYYALNHEQALLSAGQRAAEAARQATIESIRTKGLSAMSESATHATRPVIVKDNPAAWSDKDMAEVIRRVRSGEKIPL